MAINRQVKTIAEFKREVERQLVERGGRDVKVTWELAERINYPTGMPGMRGVFMVKVAGIEQRMQALFDMPKGERHTLTVKPIK